ncbi:MAG: glycosyltransferase family 2 protein [Chromatiales bacterium]|nr:glycosyltransferase family 2 protein [Chromatiales bacterium]
MNWTDVSVVIPVKNESRALREIVPELIERLPGAEIIISDDGSVDDLDWLGEWSQVTRVQRPYSGGNGAAIKTGARAATRPIVAFMDGDGQHDPADLVRILEERERKGFDMVVGARNADAHANAGRRWANALYSRIASWVVGHRVQDLTSGLRAMRLELFREFQYLLPNGFSYPTTITLCFFRSGLTVGYLPIDTRPRIGRSHIRPLRDGMRFLIIIFRISALYSPLKFYLPISALSFLGGLGIYLHSFLTTAHITNTSLLLFLVSVLTFLTGLISEQVTSLLFRRSNRDG